MTTVINTPSSGQSSDSGLGLIVGVIIALALVALFFFYGLPAIRNNSNNPGNTNVITVPLPGPTGATGATGATGSTGSTGATGAAGN